MVYLRLAQERQDPDPWRGLWPRRLPNPNETP
jgi:O-antigen ligase